MANHRGVNDQIDFDREMEDGGSATQEYRNQQSQNRTPTVNYTSYVELLRPDRKNFKPEGFNFDVDMFENLCDCWTPKPSFPLLLNCSRTDLDRFSRIVYNVDFNTIYDILTGVADMASRRAFKCLAYQGNNTAIKIVAEHFMGLTEQKNDTPNITIINDIKKDNND